MPERAANVGERFLGKDDRARPHCPDRADELDIFDSFREVVQAAAVLFAQGSLAGGEEAEAAAIAKRGGKKKALRKRA